MSDPSHPGDFRDKVVLVTGGALGLGSAAVRLFAERGAIVVVCDVREREGESLVAELLARGRRALFLLLDVASETNWQHVTKTVAAELGALHILVNNAGIIARRGLMEVTLSDWRRVMDV